MVNRIDCEANVDEIKIFARENRMNFTELRHSQVAYLYHVKGYPRRVVSEITGYALSTLSGMWKKVLHLVDKARRIFEIGVEKVQEACQYIERKFHKEIEYECADTVKPCAYVVEHYDEYGNFLWLKTGKAKNAFVRFKQHFTDKAYKDESLGKIIVKALFPCENEDDALTMENALRKFYKNRNNGADFLPQDRFTRQHFAPEHMADPKIQAQYALLMS